MVDSFDTAHSEVIFNLLIANGAELDSRDQEGRTLLSYAAEIRHEAVVKVLLAHKDVKTHSLDFSGRTPLYYAMARPSGSRGTEEAYEAVIEMLKRDSDV